MESWNGQIDWKYDFIFRCIEEKHSIHHIEKVLYHRNVEHVQVCDEQERKAIDMHLKRMNIKGNVEKTEYRGCLLYTSRIDSDKRHCKTNKKSENEMDGCT